MEGYVRISRKIIDNPMYFQEEFTRTQAWIDLIMIANYKPGFFRVRGIKVEIKRGQVGYTANNLALRWRWSKGKVIRYLNELENDKQIEMQKDNVTTLITILKYNQFQTDGTQNEKQNISQTEHRRNTKHIADGTQTDPNKKEKKNKIDKSIFKEEEIDKSISLSEKDRIFEIFFFEKGIINPEKEIERFNAHYEKTGWKDANGNDIVNKCAAALNWKTKEVTTGNTDFMNRWKKIHSEMSVKYESECNCMIFGLKSIKVSGQSIILTSTKELYDLIENSTGEIQMIIPLIKKYFPGFKFGWNVITN